MFLKLSSVHPEFTEVNHFAVLKECHISFLKIHRIDS